MNTTYFTAPISAFLLLSAVIISGIVLFITPQTTEAYSYVGHPTTQHQSPNTYWHYNRYPYTNTQHPGCQYNTQHQYQYTHPTCWQYNYGYYQYTQPVQYVYDYYDYYPSYGYSLYDYYTYDYGYYPQYTTWYGQVGQAPYCWNYGYCNYTTGTYY